MSKRGYISRYLLILKRLKSRPNSSYEELRVYLESQIEYLQLRDDTLLVGFSLRTLQRDIRDIRNLYGIDIEYSKKEKGYFISGNEIENMNFQRMMESFDVFNSLNLAQDLQPYILLENRRPQGTENLHGLLHAIKNRLQIRFGYQKFWENQVHQRIADPLALKEYRNRWYVIATDHKDQILKSFALDRLTDLELTREPIAFPIHHNIEENYRFCFGVISPQDQDPQTIVLSFNQLQGKYIKTLPLHPSQRTVVDNDQELRVELLLCITHDLAMELLSFGENVKVLQPPALIEMIKSGHQKALDLYHTK